MTNAPSGTGRMRRVSRAHSDRAATSPASIPQPALFPIIRNVRPEFTGEAQPGRVAPSFPSVDGRRRVNVRPFHALQPKEERT